MKRKKQYSRRRGALRHALWALTALFLVNHFLLVGLILPIQAIRRSEERMGTGRTAVVLRDWAPEVHKTHLIYLTGSENVTMLTGAYLTFYGWTDGFGLPVDCSEDAPLHGGWWTMGRSEGQNLVYVFGRVDDPEIARVEVQTQYEDWDTGEVVRRTAFTWSSEREAWTERNGRYYFLFQKSPVDWSVYQSTIYQVAIGYDAEGNEIARRELRDGVTSYF